MAAQPPDRCRPAAPRGGWSFQRRPFPGRRHRDPPQLDHYGLARKVQAAVPFQIGEAAHRILREAAFFTGTGMAVEPADCLRHREPFMLGPFTITPYLIDHSAFDSYCLLVEAEGRRLFYGGDIRAHGRKPGTFLELLREPPANVDVLIMEGTNIRPAADGNEHVISEVDVEDACADTFKATPGMVLALYSPQNIDRLVTMYRAALRSGRDLVLDLYGAAIAAATGRDTIPGAHWERVRVYLPNSQRTKVMESGEFHRTDAVRPRRARDARMCCVDLLVVSADGVCVIVEIEASGFLPTKICGKFFQAVLADHFIHDGRPKPAMRYASDVAFVQVLDSSKYPKEGSSKKEQAVRIASSIHELLPLRQITQYRLEFVEGPDDSQGIASVAKVVAEVARSTA